MIKNFYDYVKELIPEKGKIFFHAKNHYHYNNISLYKLADLLCGQKIDYASDVTAFSWDVETYYDYHHKMIGLMFFFEPKDEEGVENWIHFSYNAFVGAICIVATRNNITFDDPEFESLRQVWQRKIENKELEEDKKYTDLEESNFSEEWFYALKHPNSSREGLEKLKRLRKKEEIMSVHIPGVTDIS